MCEDNLLEVRPGLTPIQRFYEDTNIFITGSTGFLGRILLEKLLRSCSTLNTIYVLVRHKKGKNVQDRLNELFDDVIFERLRKLHPKFQDKIVALEGDCCLPNMGLSDQDEKILIDNVNVIFHVAATVRFDEKLKKACEINVRSVRDMISLAKKIPDLKVFMHVSTAYSNCANESRILEEVYPPPVPAKKFVSIAENLPEDLLDLITPKMLGKFPNTYAFTKAVAEALVKDEATNIPCGIHRPAIVISTYQEPICGWMNNIYGPTGLSTAAGLGLMRVTYADSEKNANIVPVDLCVNSLIASAWEVHETFLKTKEEHTKFDIPVYNYVSCNDNPINWGEYMKQCEINGIPYASSKGIWCYSFRLEKRYPIYILSALILHFLPALIVDTVLFCIGKSPMLTNAYKKVYKFSSVVAYFAMRQWDFETVRIRSLIGKMSKEDQQIFFCDLKKLNWQVFFQNYMKGLRVYLVKDPLETLPEALRKVKRFKIAHAFLKYLFSSLAVYLLYYIFKAML